MAQAHHTAVLLAGGLSKRMGQDKAGLIYQGSPLWEHQHNTLMQTDPTRCLISLAKTQELPVDDATIVRDAHDSIGPLGGLAAALEACRSPLLLTLAIDLPCMTVAFLGRLLSQAEDECGVVPVNGVYYEPLAAVYPLSLLPLVQTAIDQQDFKLQGLVKNACGQGLLKPLQVAPEEADFFRNLNTPDDLNILH